MFGRMQTRLWLICMANKLLISTFGNNSYNIHLKIFFSLEHVVHTATSFTRIVTSHIETITTNNNRIYIYIYTHMYINNSNYFESLFKLILSRTQPSNAQTNDQRWSDASLIRSEYLRVFIEGFPDGMCSKSEGLWIDGALQSDEHLMAMHLFRKFFRNAIISR